MMSSCKAWALLLAMAAVLAGCESQGPGVEGEQFLFARISGRPWFVGPCRGQVIGLLPASNDLVIQASLNTGQLGTEEVLRLEFPTEDPLRPWNYALGAGSANDGYASFRRWSNGQPIEAYTTSVIRRGQVQVTATSPGDSVLAGVFSFEAAAPDGSIRNFRGEFRTAILSSVPDSMPSTCP